MGMGWPVNRFADRPGAKPVADSDICNGIKTLKQACNVRLQLRERKEK